MRRRFAFGFIASCSFAVAVFACSSANKQKDPLPLEDDPGGHVTRPDDDDDDDATLPDDTLPDPETPPGKVYAHSEDTLYLFEPIHQKLTVVGPFSCLEESDRVLDIAVDRTGAMYGTTDKYFISIDPLTANCSLVNATVNTYPNSLSFVPAGTVDATKEALVGYAFNDTNFFADKYVRIDTATGDITDIGDLNDPGAAVKYGASGDLISLIQAGNKTYLTITDQSPDASVPTDLLAEIDPTTGRIEKVLGDTGESEIYGLGYWAGNAYGFSSDGKITEISTSTGASKVLDTLTGDGGAPLPWFGAGVTTQAPVEP